MSVENPNPVRRGATANLRENVPWFGLAIQALTRIPKPASPLFGEVKVPLGRSMGVTAAIRYLIKLH